MAIACGSEGDEMLNCNDCNDRACSTCKQMQTESDWLYEIDTGSRMCKCPQCGGRMWIGAFTYKNPYKYCPYCGRKNIKHEQISIIEM